MTCQVEPIGDFFIWIYFDLLFASNFLFSFFTQEGPFLEDSHQNVTSVLSSPRFCNIIPGTELDPLNEAFKSFSHSMIDLYQDVKRMILVDDDCVVEDLAIYNEIYSKDFAVESDKKVDISEYENVGFDFPDRYLTNGYACFSTMSLFVFRAPYNQSMVLFKYNERSIQMDTLIAKHLDGVLSSPWIPNISTDMRFDSSCPLSMTFYCIEKEPDAKKEYSEDLTCCYKVVVNDPKSRGIQRDLRFRGVRVRNVTEEDLLLCYRNLNIEPPKIGLLHECLIDLFSYLCRWEFKSLDAVEGFCMKHHLAFTVNPKFSFQANIMYFRNFLLYLVPIRLSPVDGQHRILSTICAFENSLLSQFVPTHFCKRHDEIPLPENPTFMKLAMSIGCIATILPNCALFAGNIQRP